MDLVLYAAQALLVFKGYKKVSLASTITPH